MRYPQHVFESLKPNRQLEIVRRHLIRIEEKGLSDVPTSLLSEIEKYIAWCIEPIEFKNNWQDRELENLHAQIDRYLGLSASEEMISVARGDRVAVASGEHLPLRVVLHDLRSAFNVGSILRTSECLAVEEVVFSGFTPLPSSRLVEKTAMGTGQIVAWRAERDLPGFILNEKRQGRKVFAVETVATAVDIFENSIADWPVTIILGNERFGIENEILSLCDGFLRIPVMGAKNSLNVANAFSVCAYEIFRQWRISHGN